MPTIALTRAAARQKLTAAVSAWVLFAAPLLVTSACSSVSIDDLLNGNLNLNGLGISDGPLDENSVGFFINNDFTSPILMNGRGPTGDEFFIFGTRQANGYPQSIDTILLRTRQGTESFMQFEGGWPVYVEGPDGSFARVEYLEQSQFSIVANVTLHDETNNVEETIPVSFDGLKTAEQIAAQIERLTGINVEVPQAPTSPLLGTGLALGPTALDKQDPRAAGLLVTSAIYIAFAILAINVIDFSIAIMGQVFTESWNGAAAVVPEILTVMFSPLITIGTLVSTVLDRVQIAPLVDIVIEVPSRPRARN